MIVSLASIEGPVSLQDSGFEPVSVGKVIEGAITRRGLTVESVASASGLPLGDIAALIEGRLELDRTRARKLQTVFPKTMRLFLNIQRSHAFFERYGVLRPDSPVRRAMIAQRFTTRKAA